MSTVKLSQKGLIAELGKQMWESSNKLIWGMVFFVVFVSILDFVIVPNDYLELTLLKLAGIFIIVFTHYFLSKVLERPIIILHIALSTLILIYLLSISLTNVDGQILYLVVLSVTFVCFNTIAIWRVSDAVAQFMVLCVSLLVFDFLEVIELQPLWLLGGYTSMAVCAVSSSFPAIKILSLKDRIQEDLSEKKQVVSLRMEKLQLEKSLNEVNAQLKAFEKEAKIFRHDLKNRLGSVQSLVELIEMEERYIFEAGQDDYLGLIKTSVVDAIEENDGLFKLFNAREDVQNSELIQSQVDLHGLINSNRLKIAEILTSKNIKLKTDLQANRHQVYTDKNLADIVIYNLFKYAVKFSKNNDTLHVNTRIENEFIIIDILNKKSGISMANMESHFKNINDYKLKDIQQAKGLGLSIAKNHIELLGGYLRYSSSVSLGFEFLAEFKLNQEAKP